MFVYLIGNSQQNIFKLGTAIDPFKQLAKFQLGNPHKLSVISQICVKSQNEAGLIESLGQKALAEHEGSGGWLVAVPVELSAQFVSGYYLRSLAHKANVTLLTRKEQAVPRKGGGLQRLSAIAQQKALSFDTILEQVEQAYEKGMPIDDLFL